MTWSDIFVQALIYVLLWFFCVFIVLPFGVRRDENPEPGHDAGAPANPALKKKALATTILAAILWGIYFYFTNILGFSLEKLFR